MSKKLFWKTKFTICTIQNVLKIRPDLYRHSQMHAFTTTQIYTHMPIDMSVSGYLRGRQERYTDSGFMATVSCQIQILICNFAGMSFAQTRLYVSIVVIF